MKRDIISGRDASRQDTQSLTLRLSKSSVDKLKKIAAKKNMTTNALVSQIVDSFLGWELNAAEAGWVVMPKPFLIELFEKLDQETVVTVISQISKRMAKDITHYMKGKHDLQGWLSIIRGRAERSGFHLTEHQQNQSLVIIMQHDMGENWSVYFETFYENVFDDLGVKSEFDHTDKSLIIKLHDIPDHILYHK
ncbi:MAG: hypothetical protein KGH83_05080 [Thaumarchaeota archaeon]|nr:hypothetical protein [Nitrososphaerota archaeon]